MYPLFILKIIVGGVQKSGTTSLFSYLSTHPDLLPSSQKETHFFDNEKLDWSSPDYSLLQSFYPHSDTRQLPFDITPIYLFWPPSLRRIYNYNPAMKLIFIFRVPIERAWSHWKMETSRNAEKLPFHTAIRSGRARLNGISLLDPAWRRYSYIERGLYASQLKKLYEIFPPEQILLLRSTDLLQNHVYVLKKISEFLTIEDFPNQPARNEFVNTDNNASLCDEDIRYLRDLFYDEVLEFSKISKLSVHDWLTLN